MFIKNRINNYKYLKDIESYIQISDFSKLENKTILITGATGLIGAYLVDFLIYSNINIKIILICQNKNKAENIFKQHNTNKIIYLEANICNNININLKIDYIIHLASPADPLSFANKPIETMNINFIATQNLLELAYQNKAKFIFASTGEVYGEFKKGKIKENNFGYLDILETRNCYNESKRAAETLCKAYSVEKKVDFIIIRIPRCFGPTMKTTDNRAISFFIKKSVLSEDIWLKSSGNQKYSYIYVGDCVTSIIYAINKLDNNNAYNIGSNENMSLFNMAKTISRFNKKSNFKQEICDEFNSNGYSKVKNSILDTSKIEKFGWKPLRKIKENLKITYDILKESNNV